MKVFFQMFLIVFTMVMGFLFTYGIVWMKIGLPLTTWALMILFVLAGLSTIGLIRWTVTVKR